MNDFLTILRLSQIEYMYDKDGCLLVWLNDRSQSKWVNKLLLENIILK